MPSLNVEIKNLPQIRAAFTKAPGLMVKGLNAAIAKAVFKIKINEVNEYRGLGIRVITGGLIGSIQRGQYFSNLRGEVGPNVTGSEGVKYAGFVHWGTRFMNARPFLLNAVQDSQRDVNKYFQEAVQDVLDTIAKETG